MTYTREDESGHDYCILSCPIQLDKTKTRVAYYRALAQDMKATESFSLSCTTAGSQMAYMHLMM
jgi:hypothetical protein